MTFRYEARNGGVVGWSWSCPGRCLLKDLGRAQEVLECWARMRGAGVAGKRHRRQQHRLGCFYPETDSPSAIPYRKLRHVAEEAPTTRPARDLSTLIRPDKMREAALMSHTNP